MIVVTGATGNVGRTLIRLLAEQGHEVTAVARHITQADAPHRRPTRSPPTSRSPPPTSPPRRTPSSC